MRSSQRLSIPIHLERHLPDPLQDQLAGQIRAAIDAGRLAAGTRMPSTRTLAAILRVSRGVAVTAYQTLYGENYITGRRGSGTYVTAVAQREERAVPAPAAVAEEPIGMQPDRPSPHGFPLTAWRAAWRRAGHHPPPVEELPPAGLPELRRAIAVHLRDTRGLVLDQHEIIVAAGYGHATQRLLTALRGAAPDLVIGLEEPASPMIRAALDGHGTVLPVPVDDEGVRVDLIGRRCDALIVRPERNDPLGVRMSLRRRAAVADWAAEQGVLVIEPAFDGLFDTGLSPRPSILSLGDPELTAMAGTFAGILTPTLRLAYLVAPRRLAPAIERHIATGAEQPSFPSQRAVAELLASGCVAGRVDQLSRLYAPKRRLVAQALGAFPGARLLGADTGSAVTLVLPARISAEQVIRALRERRVHVTALDSYYHPRERGHNGLVIGYGHLDDMTLRRALRVIAATLHAHGLPRRAAGHRQTVA
ncbi:PLP-dependent aminotransferase family protein [Nonomuraea sp. NN258]|uniref:aminotransferase-like domain-containing protein n=1 Tax=Nonomuraea antri TaxID=2730852 RepID=UPI001567D7FB|nr:PLP-dependent aminotransferase family protein [Nonomuraea antri]NRQ32398.1 PLP-dependent aminotransferase family protein [Nonomuraea antri]